MIHAIFHFWNYSWTSTKDHLSTMVTSLQQPFFGVHSIHVHHDSSLNLSTIKWPLFFFGPQNGRCGEEYQLHYIVIFYILLVVWCTSLSACKESIKVSNSSRLVDFAIGLALVCSILMLPGGQVMFFREFKSQKNCKQIFCVSWNDVWTSTC